MSRRLARALVGTERRQRIECNRPPGRQVAGGQCQRHRTVFPTRVVVRDDHRLPRLAASIQHPREALPADIKPGLDEQADYSSSPAWPNGTHICEIEIDEQTGRVALTRYVAVDDVGTMINPMLVEGQIFGGIAQGAGQALVEDLIYDQESGQLVTGSFTDYCMPRADDFCAFELHENPIPTATNPLGVKGAGESGTCGSLPAVMSAVNDALASIGGPEIEMPATPEKVWRAINATETAA